MRSGPGKKDRRPAYGGGEARLRVSKERRAPARGCGAAPAGVGRRAGRQVSAASAFGGDGAAPGSCGWPLALAPRPRPPSPLPAAAAGDPRPGPAGRAAAARCAAVALVRPRRGELGAARGRARGPGSPRRPLAPQRARGGPGLRPGPGLRRQAGQQHAPGERAPGPGAARTARCHPRPPPPAAACPARAAGPSSSVRATRGSAGETRAARLPRAARTPRAAARNCGGRAESGPGAAPGTRRPARLCFVTGEAALDCHGILFFFFFFKLPKFLERPCFVSV